jgi:hypothetical protein
MCDGVSSCTHCQVPNPLNKTVHPGRAPHSVARHRRMSATCIVAVVSLLTQSPFCSTVQHSTGLGDKSPHGTHMNATKVPVRTLSLTACLTVNVQMRTCTYGRRLHLVWTAHMHSANTTSMQVSKHAGWHRAATWSAHVEVCTWTDTSSDQHKQFSCTNTRFITDTRKHIHLTHHPQQLQLRHAYLQTKPHVHICHCKRAMTHHCNGATRMYDMLRGYTPCTVVKEAVTPRT